MQRSSNAGIFREWSPGCRLPILRLLRRQPGDPRRCGGGDEGAGAPPGFLAEGKREGPRRGERAGGGGGGGAGRGAPPRGAGGPRDPALAAGCTTVAPAGGHLLEVIGD